MFGMDEEGFQRISFGTEADGFCEVLSWSTSAGF
jgi:hypothetical protein